MPAYQMSMIEFLLYQVKDMDGNEIGTVQFDEDSLVPHFTFKNEWVEGTAETIGAACIILLTSYKENTQ